MIHLIQLLLNLLLKIDEGLPDNSRLAGSIFMAGAWLILIAEIFARQLEPWRDWCFWGGWVCTGLAMFLFIRRQIRKWQGSQRKRSLDTILK